MGNQLTAVDWVVRICVALVFLLFGMEKLAGSGWVKLFADIGFGQWFRYFTGIVQVTGATLYAIPRTARAGMAILACTMLGAIGVHLFVLPTGLAGTLIPAILLGVVVFGWKRGEFHQTDDFLRIR